MGEQATVVIPCFNEGARLDLAELARLCTAGFRLVLVNDGSTDDTATRLRAFAAEHVHDAELIDNQQNRGKAESVRRGLLCALENDATIVGYLDADLSTPVDEYIRLVEKISETRAAVAMASRIRFLGNRIDRRPMRHYLGRVFATAASLTLELAVYDTQCGAKAFRRTDALARALDRPFDSRWVFDVELIGRLLNPPPGVTPLSADDFIEVPLSQWRDPGGSKLSVPAMARAGLDLLRLYARNRLG